jgi:anti-sigma factor RsiW
MAPTMGEHRDDLDLACRELVELVTDYLDGALDPRTAAAIDRHLHDCPGCAEYLAQLRTTIAVTGQLKVEPPSDRAAVELLAAFREHMTRER